MGAPTALAAVSVSARRRGLPQHRGQTLEPAKRRERGQVGRDSERGLSFGPSLTRSGSGTSRFRRPSSPGCPFSPPPAGGCGAVLLPRGLCHGRVPCAQARSCSPKPAITSPSGHRHPGPRPDSLGVSDRVGLRAIYLPPIADGPLLTDLAAIPSIPFSVPCACCCSAPC